MTAAREAPAAEPLPVRAFSAVLRDLVAGRDLSAETAAEALDAIVDGLWNDAQAAAFLTALAIKGERTSEVFGLARAMRARAIRVEHDLAIVADTCGTGGDGAQTINVSTAAAFAVAGCGVAIAKHGNRATSGTCGSADVLETLGVAIDVPPAEAARRLARDRFVFLFAPHYHPATKRVASVRRALGIRTVFNLLGPLVNPAGATHQIVGVADRAHLTIVAETLQALGVRGAAVVRAANGIDEVAGDHPTEVVQLAHGSLRRYLLDPNDFGIRTPPEALRGGEIAANADALLAILRGEISPRSEVVALNAALALVVAERASTMREALAFARASLRSGAALAVFEAARDASAEPLAKGRS